MGLKVLKVLQSEPIASLHDIHLATAISKPSLLRILTRWSGRAWSRGVWPTAAIGSAPSRVVRKRDRYDRVAEAAAPVLARLCEKVKWPSDLFVPAGDCMERRETSRSHSPFVLPGLPPPSWWAGRVADDGCRARLSRVVSREGAGRDLAQTPEIQQPAGLARARPEEARENSQ